MENSLERRPWDEQAEHAASWYVRNKWRKYRPRISRKQTRKSKHLESCGELRHEGSCRVQKVGDRFGVCKRAENIDYPITRSVD